MRDPLSQQRVVFQGKVPQRFISKIIVDYAIHLSRNPQHVATYNDMRRLDTAPTNTDYPTWPLLTPQ